jgi:hypothetical protein
VLAAPTLATAKDDQQQRGPSFAGYCFVCDCERVRVTGNAIPATEAGNFDAPRFASVGGTAQT